MDGLAEQSATCKDEKWFNNRTEINVLLQQNSQFRFINGYVSTLKNGQTEKYS